MRLSISDVYLPVINGTDIEEINIAIEIFDERFPRNVSREMRHMRHMRKLAEFLSKMKITSIISLHLPKRTVALFSFQHNMRNGITSETSRCCQSCRTCSGDNHLRRSIIHHHFSLNLVVVLYDRSVICIMIRDTSYQNSHAYLIHLYLYIFLYKIRNYLKFE